MSCIQSCQFRSIQGQSFWPLCQNVFTYVYVINIHPTGDLQKALTGRLARNLRLLKSLIIFNNICLNFFYFFCHFITPLIKALKSSTCALLDSSPHFGFHQGSLHGFHQYGLLQSQISMGNPVYYLTTKYFRSTVMKCRSFSEF